MRAKGDTQSVRGERTLLTALLLSAPGPIVLGISLFLGRSATQAADFIRRSAELCALIASYILYRRLKRHPSDAVEKASLTRLVNVFVGAAMVMAGGAMLAVAAVRLGSQAPGGNVIMGLAVAALGLVTNGWFFLRYRKLVREGLGPVMAAQQRLYRAKTWVDFTVAVALTAVAVAPNHPATRYIDALGSAAVACYLLYNGIRTLRKK